MSDRRGVRAEMAGASDTVVSIPRRRLSDFLRSDAGALTVCALTHVVGQCCNLLFQILLARRFGLAGYGDIGLAHLLFGLICFAGDLGYSSLFLREDPSQQGWSRLWRAALAHKLVATLALYGAALAGWLLTYGTHGTGLSYLVATLPAALFFVASLWPPLLAQGRRIAAFCVQQSAWPVALFLWAAFAGEAISAGEVGMLVSIGFAVQLAASLAAWKRPGDLLPTLVGGAPLLRAALSLSTIGLAGVAYDRVTPFLVSLLAPRFLPVFLLLGHGLNGLSGIASQINRLLLPRVVSEVGLRWSLGLTASVLVGTGLMLQVVLLLMRAMDGEVAGLQPELVMPTILAWAIATMGGVAATEMIGRRREGVLARIILIGIAVGAILQILATVTESAEGVVWVRAMCALGMTAVSLLSCGISPRFAGLLLCGSIFAVSLGPHMPWLWPASSAMLVLALICIAGGRPVFTRRDIRSW